MNGKYTVEQVIEITMNVLKGIRPPIEFFDEIAVPIHQCVSNLEECLKAMEKARNEKDADANAE